MGINKAKKDRLAGKNGIQNDTKKTALSTHFRVCNSAWSKAIGLMFSREEKVLRESLVFEFDSEARRSLHMWFVPYTIDVIFLDEKKTAVEIKEGFRPWGFYAPRTKSKYVLELPSGSVKQSRTKVGDRISW